MANGFMGKLLQLAWYELNIYLQISIDTELFLSVSCLMFIQIMAVDMSYRLGWIDDTIKTRVHNILTKANLPIAPPDVMTVDMFKATMAVSN